MASPIQNRAITFPEELCLCIKNQPLPERRHHLTEALVNQATRNQFKLWAQQHINFVQCCPTMRQICNQVLEYESLNDDRFAVLIQSFTHSLSKGVDAAKVCEEIENGNFDFKNVNAIRAHLLLEYINIGIISLDNPLILEGALPFFKCLPVDGILTLISNQKNKLSPASFSNLTTNLYPLFQQVAKRTFSSLQEPESLKTAQKFFKNLAPKGLMDLFDKKIIPFAFLKTLQPDEFLDFYFKIGKEFWRIAEKEDTLSLIIQLPKDDLIKLFSFKIPDRSRLTALFFDKFMPLLNNLDSDTLFKIISIQDPELNTVFHKIEPQSASKFLSIFEQLTIDDRFKLLSIRNSAGETLLHNRCYDEIASSLLNDFDNEQLIKLFSLFYSDGVFIFLRDFDGSMLSAILPFINKRDILLKVLSITHPIGGCTLLFHRPHLEILLPSLNALDSSSLFKIIAVQSNGWLNTAFHTYKIIPQYLPLFNILTSEDRFKMLSIQNDRGATILHNSNNAPIALSLLEGFSKNQLLQLFSKIDYKGRSFLENYSMLLELLPLINKNNLEYEIISIRNPQGSTLLFDQALLDILLPFLNTLSPDALFKIISLQNNKLETAFHYMKTTDTYNFEITPQFLSLLNMLTIEDCFKLLTLQDLQGKTILHNRAYAAIAPTLLKYFSNAQLMQLFSLFDNEDFSLSILANVPMLSAFLPLIKKRGLEEDVMSIRNFDGSTLLFDQFLLEILLPFLNNLPSDALFKIISVQNINLKTAFHHMQSWDNPNFELKPQFLSLLSKLTIEDRFKMLTMLDNQGMTILHNRAYATIAPTLLENFSNAQLMELFSLFYIGGLSLSFLANFNTLLALLPLINQRGLEREVVSTVNPYGSTLLFDQALLELFLPFLNSLPSEALFKIISVQNYNLDTAFHYMQSWYNSNVQIKPQFLSLLSKLTIEDRFKMLTLQNFQGQTILHNFAYATEAPALLKNFSKEQLIQLFSLFNYEDMSFLENDAMLFALQPLIQERGIDLDQIMDPSELSILEKKSHRVSIEWIHKPKMVTTASLISDKEYSEKISKLHSDFEKLWKTLSFGVEEGKVDPILLEINIHDTPHPFSPDEAWNALKELLNLMKEKKAWLGTPPADQTENLHRFYCTLLADYETIAMKLKEITNNQTEVAGNLISLASVMLEGRCATGCQIEARQKKEILTGKNCDLNSLMTNAIDGHLYSMIESIVGQEFGGDAHAMSQFLYAAGLVTIPDHLSRLSVEVASERILANWTLASIVRGFGKGVPQEFAIEWLKLQTPPEYGPEYLAAINECEVKERALLGNFKQKLLGNFPAETTDKLLTLIPLFWGATIPTSELKTGEQRELIRTAFSRAAQTLKAPVLERASLFLNPDQFNKTDLAEASKKIRGFFSSHRDNLRNILLEKLKNLEGGKVLANAEEKAKQQGKPMLSDPEKIALLPMVDRAHYTQQLREMQNTETSLLQQLEAILTFEGYKQELGIAPNICLEILKLKEEYEQQLTEIGKSLLFSDLEISFSRKMHRLPSHACDDARRLKYCAPFLVRRNKTLLEILTRLGVIERTLQNLH